MFTALVAEMNDATTIMRSNNHTNRTETPKWLQIS